jgi:outer membrane murein-binding lipoprotein Lpp
MSRYSRIFTATLVASTALAGLSSTARAQTAATAATTAEAPAAATDGGNEIIVTGTRASGQSAARKR